MTLSPRHAQASLREAIRQHQAQQKTQLLEFKRLMRHIPETLRGFAKGFKEHERINQKFALLIVNGRMGRRKAVWMFFHPVFAVDEDSFCLRFASVRIEFVPGKLRDVDFSACPVEISQHALERAFQRIGSFHWTDVRACLSDMSVYLPFLPQAYFRLGYKQCVFPANQGNFVGIVDAEEICLRTFLSHGNNEKSRVMRVRDALVAAYEANKATVEEALIDTDPAAVDAAIAVFERVLDQAEFWWLRLPYVPSVDPLKEAFEAPR